MKKYRFIIENIVSFLVLLISMTLFLMSMINYKKTENKIIEFDDQTTNALLRIIDIYDTEGEKTLNEVFSESDILLRMKLFNEEMNNNYDYIEYDNQSLLIKSNEFKYKDSCRIDYGTSIWKENDDIGIFLKSLQVNKLAYEYLGFEKKIKYGNGFTTEDYDLTEEVPVILGWEYKELLQLENVYSFEYITRNINLKVIGFLEKNSFIVINDEIVSLDNYIIMPFLSIKSEPKDSEEHTFQKILYSLKNWGYIKVKNGDNFYKYSNEVSNISSKLNLKYVANEASISPYINNIAASFDSIKLIFMMLTILMLFIAVILNIWLSIWDYKRHQKTYAIHLICGCPLLILKIRIFEIVFTKYVIAIFGSLRINYYLQTNMNEYIYRFDILDKCSPIMVIIGIVMVAVTYFAINYYIENNSIYSVIKGDR